MADAVSSSLSNDGISYQLMVTLYQRVVAVHAVDVLINRQSCSDCDWSKDAASPDGVGWAAGWCCISFALAGSRSDRRPGSRVVCNVFPVFLISVCFDELERSPESFQTFQGPDPDGWRSSWSWWGRGGFWACACERGVTVWDLKLTAAFLFTAQVNLLHGDRSQ